MMSKNLRQVQSSVKRYMASAAPKAAPAGSSSLPSTQVKVSTLPSGITLASIDTDTALARVAVTIRAGARYEPETQLGITHALRSAAGLTTKNYTTFGITRNIEYYGGRLSVIGQRDTITYLLEAHNQDDLLQKNFAMLADTISNPEFKHWELDDNLERMKADLALVEQSPEIQLADALHKAAFKGGLRKSLYASKQMVGKHSKQDLMDFIGKRFVSPNTVVVGYGVDHQELVGMVGKGINLGASAAGKCNAKYIGGEIHLDHNLPLTYVAMAAEGAGLASSKDSLAAALFSQILGVDGVNGRLNAAVSKAAGDSTVYVSSFSMNYEETGLVGINLIAPSSADVTGMLKAAVKELKAAATGVTDADIAQAKNLLKNSVLIGSDKPVDFTTDVAFRLLAQGKAGTPADLCKEIDSLSAADVKAIAGKIAKGKPSLATLGRNAPYLTDILE